MSKRGGFPGMGGFGGMNLNQLMKEAKKMQSDMEKSQEELAEKEFEASAGGEAVKVKVSGRKEIKELKIKPEVLDPDDVEMLEDLIRESDERPDLLRIGRDEKLNEEIESLTNEINLLNIEKSISFILFFSNKIKK